MSKQPPPAPTASAIGPCPTIIQTVGRLGTGSLPRTFAPPDHPLMTKSVRVCLSYDPLKIEFYRFQNGQYFKKKRIVVKDVVNDVTTARQSVITRVVIRFLHVWDDIIH